nr:hypothetical protein [Tanacetum cinerariifolium]
MAKKDMDLYHSRLTQYYLNELIIKYQIPRDLHPWLPSKEFVMFELPNDAIGVYHRIFYFYGVRISFSSFLLALIKHYKVHFSQLGPLGLNTVVTFELICRSLQIEPKVMLFRIFQTLSKQGHWFSFTKRHALSPFCIDDNRFLMGIHDFIFLPEWTGARARVLLILLQKIRVPKGIMTDAVVAPPVVASRPRPSSGLAFSFREISEDAIHRDFFPFSLGLYYATYPEGDVARNYEFSHEEWDASRQPTLMILTKEVLRILLFARPCWTNFQHRMKWSRLKVFGLRKQVAGLNDKLSSSDATFAKYKAKGKEKKKKIKSLTKSLDNLQAEVAGLSTDLNRVTILEVDKDDEILYLKANPPEFASFLRGQFQCLVWKFLAFDEFSRVQAELLSLKSSAGFEHFEHAIEPLSVILQLEPEKLARPANVPASKDANVSSPLVKESIVTPAYKPLDFPSNVIHASSTAALEPNEEVHLMLLMMLLSDGSLPSSTADKEAAATPSGFKFLVFLFWLLMFLSYSLVYVLLMTLLFIGVVCSKRGDRRDSSFGLSPKFSCFDFAIPHIVHVRGVCFLFLSLSEDGLHNAIRHVLLLQVHSAASTSFTVVIWLSHWKMRDPEPMK